MSYIDEFLVPIPSNNKEEYWVAAIKAAALPGLPRGYFRACKETS